MGNDTTVKQNCAQPRSLSLTFDGLTDDAFCFASTVASATSNFEQIPTAECLDFYVQGGDGQSVVKTADICPRSNKLFKAAQQQSVIQTLANAGFQRWTKWMYALSEALTPMTLQAAILRGSESIRLKDLRKLDDKITDAKKVLCWHDGYSRDRKDLSPVLAEALEDCLSPDEVDKNKAEKEKNDNVVDISDWGPSWWKSALSLQGRAEKIVLEGTVELNNLMVENVETTLLILDLPNTLKSLSDEKREEIKNILLKRQESRLPEDAFLRRLSLCDIETLAFIKSAVPTLSLTLQAGNTTLKSFLADRTFLEQAKKVVDSYGDDVAEAQFILESAISYYTKPDDRGAFVHSLNEVRQLLIEFPRFGNYEDLNAALAIIDKIERTSPDLQKQAAEALKLITRYEQALTIENESDMDLAVNAKIFMIDEFSRRAGRAEFGKVLLATLWMNQGWDATVEVDRIRRFVRAQDLLKRVERCKLSVPELRWLDEVNRLLDLLGAPVRKAAKNSVKSCAEKNPSEEYNPVTDTCEPCGENEEYKLYTESCMPKKARQVVVLSNKGGSTAALEQKQKQEQKQETKQETNSQQLPAPEIDCDITPVQMMKLGAGKLKQWKAACE